MFKKPDQKLITCSDHLCNNEGDVPALPTREIDLFIGINPYPKVRNDQMVGRLKRHCDIYSHPPMVASPYCSTGYLTANRGPSIYFIKPGMGKHRGSVAHDKPLMKLDFDPRRIIDYPNQLMTKVLTPEEKSQMDDLFKRMREKAKGHNFTVIGPKVPLMYSEDAVKEEVIQLKIMGVPRDAIDYFLLVAMAGSINDGLDRKGVMQGVVRSIKCDAGNWLEHIPEYPDDYQLSSDRIRLHLKIAVYRTHLKDGRDKSYSFLATLLHDADIESFIDDYSINVRKFAMVENKKAYIMYSDAKALAYRLVNTGSLRGGNINWRTEPMPRFMFS